MSTVLILLDAFRHDYLTEDATPFLWRCAQEGEHYQGVEQSLGFCERSEMLTGLRGDETGFFTAVGFDPPNSPYAGVPALSLLNRAENCLLLFLRLLPTDFAARAHARLRRYAARSFRKRGITMPAYFVPYSWLPLFALTEDRQDHRQPDAFPAPSILALLDEAGRTYCYETFTALGFHSPFRSDQERLEAVVRDAARAPKDLYLVYIATPDAFGHRYGPDSQEFRAILRRLDSDLEHFTRGLEQAAPGNRYLFLGDHGMLTVTRHLDAEKEITRLLQAARLRRGSDVVYFLDSTMVRLWALSGKAHSRLPEALSTSEVFGGNGAWMEAATAAHHHVPWPDRRYGDHLWVANPGVLVFPDFFHRLHPCKGMHGYDPRLPQSQGVCIRWGQGIAPEKHPVMPLTGVFDLLKRSLEL